MNRFNKRHERGSKERIGRFQNELNKKREDSNALKLINSRLDAQLKIEDFILKSREANHPKYKAWGPIVVSGAGFVISVAIAYASWFSLKQASVAHALELRKAKAEIILKAAGNNPEETRANLAALTEVGLLDLSPGEIEKLKPLRPAK